MSDLEKFQSTENSEKRLAVAKALGSAYEIFGYRRYSLPEFCEKAWMENDIPVMHGRHGIGKTGVVIPYLKSMYPDLVAIDEDKPVDDPYPVPSPSNRLVVVMSLVGAYGDHYQMHLHEAQRLQRKRLAYYNMLPINFQSQTGEVLLRPTDDTVKDIARALYSDHPKFDEEGLNHWRWERSFQKIADGLCDNSRSNTLQPALGNLTRLAEDAGYFRKRIFGFF